MFKRFIKKFLKYFILASIISTSLSFVYIFFPKLIDSIDSQIRDSFFILRGEIKKQSDVIIVDIDEKSIKSLGQWPWSRDKIADIINNLNNNDVAIIGMDMVFAEEDRTSPSKILKEYSLSQNVPDYDEIFASTIENSPLVLGYSFELSSKDFIEKDAPSIPAIFIESGKSDENSYLLQAYGTTLNIPLYQKSAYSSGFFNIVPDESGIIRSVPLLIDYDDILYPSLSLEMVRILNDSKKVVVNYDENGVSNIVLDDIIIPTDMYARMFINYRGAQNSFKYYSAVDIYNNLIPYEELEDKIVLFGTSAVGLFDLRATPYDNIFPGVEVHANIIDNIFEGDFIQKPSWADGANLLLIILLTFMVVFFTTFVSFLLKPLVFIVYIFAYLLINYKLLFDYGMILNIIFPLFAIVIASITTMAMDYFYNIQQERAIKKKFASKVSKTVMDDILKNIDSDKFSVHSKEVTIFFSDIRGFTSLSEKLKPKELIGFLNRYMEPMSEIVIKYDGTIDKYIGDAIMAYWNAPLDTPNHADLALKASLEQFEALKELNKELSSENLPTIDIGIGLNSGDVIVGEMGSKIRSDYTVIGDTINLGSRVESLCKFYGTKLNITNFTKEKLKDEYVFRFLDLVRVKGKKLPVEIWQVLGYQVSQEYIDELKLYEKALNLYRNMNFKEALEIFNTLEASPDKIAGNIYKIYQERCEIYIEHPPQDFDGVFEHISK